MAQFESLDFQWIDLWKYPGLCDKYMDGQTKALNRFGIIDFEFPECDFKIKEGTFAVIAFNEQKEPIAGVRVHTRNQNQSLPIESTDSPLDSSVRSEIANHPNLVEIRGAWVCPHYSGQNILQRIIHIINIKCFDLGYHAIIGLTHTKFYQSTMAKVGYFIDENIGTVNYPNDAYQSFVIWNQLNSDKWVPTQNDGGL